MRVPPGSQLVFDQIVQSGTSAGQFDPTKYVYSDPKFNDWLGKGNDLKLFAVASRGTGAGSFIVTVQEAGDEELAWALTYPEGAPVRGSVLSPGEFIATGMDIETNRQTYPGILGVNTRASVGQRRLLVAVAPGSTTAISARIRVWASGHNGYRRFHRLLISEYIQGNGLLFGPHDSCAWLAGTDILSVGLQTDEVSGSSQTASLFFGESPNGRIWTDATPGSFSIASGTFYMAGVATSASAGKTGFVRFGVQLGASDTAATVRLWVTGRDVRSG